MQQHFRIKEQKTIFSGGLLRVDLESVEFPDGNVHTREVVRHPGAVGIIPITDDQSVILLRQYRQPLRDFLLEIPAGLRESGEEASACARRELKEETGATVGDLVRLGAFFTTPGYSDEFFHLFLAFVTGEGDQALDEDEFLEVVRIPFTEAVAMAERGEITDAKSIIALMLAARFYKNSPTRATT